MDQLGMAWKIITTVHILIGICVGLTARLIANFFRELDGRNKFILQILENNDRLYGQEIVQLSNGKIGRGTVYVLLSILEDDGYIRSRVDSDAENRNPFKRRSYAITSRGRFELFRR